jgi:hypothetical protein
MPENELNVLHRPQCQHFRSKGMYVSGVIDPATDDFEGHGDGYCWCNQTQFVYGPDDQYVDRQECNSGRSCYQPML